MEGEGGERFHPRTGIFRRAAMDVKASQKTIAGRRGILVMPRSMASTSEKSLTIHGKGEPSG